MARYSYLCPGEPDASECHEIDRWFDMGQAPSFVTCEEHQHKAPRYFDFQFQQDNRRFRKGRSAVTGERYAESRAEERRIEKERGIEFIGRGEMPEKWKRAAEYSRHVKTGGDRDASLERAIAAPEPVKSKTILQRMAEKGVRVPS